MDTHLGIIKSKDPKTISVLRDAGNAIGLKLTVDGRAAEFLLHLQENDYRVSIFDYGGVDSDSLTWVRLIRRLRPKLPLILVGDHLDKSVGAQMYQEGIFYLGLRPLDAKVLVDVLQAAVRSSNSTRRKETKGTTSRTSEQR